MRRLRWRTRQRRALWERVEGREWGGGCGLRVQNSPALGQGARLKAHLVEEAALVGPGTGTEKAVRKQQQRPNAIYPLPARDDFDVQPYPARPS